MKIAFVDIDGTILDYSRGINFPSETCIDMFKRFKDQGNILIIATSRAQLPPGLNKDMFDGFVFSNGQYIEYRKEVLLNNAFTREQILLQQAIYKKYDAGSFFSGVKGQWMSSFRKELAIEHMVYFGLDPDKVDEMFLPFVIEEVESNAATAAFDNSNNMWLAKAELPQDWIIHGYKRVQEASVA